MHRTESSPLGWTVHLEPDHEIRFGPVLCTISTQGFELPLQLRKNAVDARWTPDGTRLVLMTAEPAGGGAPVAFAWVIAPREGAVQQLARSGPVMTLVDVQDTQVTLYQGATLVRLPIAH